MDNKITTKDIVDAKEREMEYLRMIGIQQKQTWNWDTVIHISDQTGKKTINGTDIEVFYDKENAVYRRAKAL